MRIERLLIEWDRFQASLERPNPQAVFSRRRTTLAWAIAAVLSQACAIRRMPSDALRREVATDVAIAISNNMSRALRIYLHAGSVDLSLGTVPALATRTFLVPGGFTDGAGELQIEARERGAEVGLLTERFALGPRRVVAWAVIGASSTSVTVR
jgi:hypothetical protein